MMSVLALLALLCGVGASVQAQTASFSGVTNVFNTSPAHFTSAEGITTDASGNLFIAVNDGTAWNVYEMKRTGPGAYSAPVALPTPAGGYGCTGILYCLRNVAVSYLDGTGVGPQLVFAGRF